jgi:hypothetical protein
MTANGALIPILGFLAGASAAFLHLWLLRSTVTGLRGSKRPKFLTLSGFALRTIAIGAIFALCAWLGGIGAILAAAVGFAIAETIGVIAVARRPMNEHKPR